MKPTQHSVLTAVFAIIAFGLLVATASTCRFVRVLIGDASSFFGVYCTNGYDDENDIMWIMARIMLSCALVFDAVSSGIAIAIAWLTPPTKNRWQAISMMAAISAVFKVPVFLAFQAEPCSDVDCEFSLGGYFLLFSITFSIAITILTQCLDPPKTPRNVTVPDKRGRLENLNQNNEDRLSINRTMTEDEEERLTMGGTRPQEAKVGDTESQTILLGESESQNMVIRNAMTRDTEISALTDNPREVEPASLDQAAANSALESRSALRSGRGDGSVSEYTYSQDLLRVEEVRYTVERSPKDDSPSPPPPPPPALAVANNLARTPTDLLLDATLEEPSELQSTPSELFVKPSRSDDLGSLAPTITGDDSILDQSRDATSDNSAKNPENIASTEDDFKIIRVDQTQKTTRDEPNTSKNIGDTVQKVITSPFDIGKALVTRAKRKRRMPSRLKCYRLMDDDDMESTYPISPPLEILTVKLSTDSDQEDRLPTEHEKALIDQWNALHGNGTTPHSTEVEDPDLYLSSDEESGDDLPPQARNIGEAEEGDSPIKSTMEGSSNRTRLTKRTKKSRSRRLVYSGLSVASGPSLLSMENVIEEETAADLEESSASEQGSIERFDPYGATLAPVPITRTRSAPNLASFARQKTERGFVHEDLKLTGMHSYHSAEIFRVRGRSTQSLSGKRNRRLVSLSPQSPKNPIRDIRSLPPAKKTPLFRQERARTGIHRSAGNLSDHSSSDDNLNRSIRSTGVLSRRARLARIRRLQQLSYPVGSASGAGRTPPKANRISEFSTPPKQGAAKLAVEFSTPPFSGGTHRSARSAGTISSGNLSSASDCFSIDLLDVQLAELSRPDGGSKGPDEESF
jgi:hypothetical protein